MNVLDYPISPTTPTWLSNFVDVLDSPIKYKAPNGDCVLRCGKIAVQFK